MSNADIIYKTDAFGSKYDIKVKKEFYNKNVRPFKSSYETPRIESGYYMVNLDCYLREAIKKGFIDTIFELAQFKDELLAKQNLFKSYLIELLNKYNVRENILPKISDSSLSRYDITDDIIDRDVPIILDKCSIDEITQIFVMSTDVSDNILKQKKYREFMGRKDAIKESIGYLKDESVKQNLLYELNEMINMRTFDVSKLEAFKIKYNEIIKNEYKQKMGKVNYTPGKPFDLICHSVKGVNFDGEFHSSLVSTSYINEEINDVYNKGYGFIMNPDDIVLTGEKDTMLNNWSDDIQTATVSHNYSFFLHPNYIKRVNIELKKQKKEKGEKGRIYNEIDLDNFRPIGIFCLTNGSKTLDDNYQKALELQKKFPYLEITDIDLTLYKNIDEQERLKSDLIKILNEKEPEFWKCYNLTSNSEVIQSIMGKYDLFYQKYLELKRNGNFSEDDIINLYVDYTGKLIFGKVEKEEIFSGKYDEQEIYFYLDNKYYFSSMFNGFSLFELGEIKKDFSNFNFDIIKNQNIRTIIQTLATLDNNFDKNLLMENLGKRKATDINDFINRVYEVATIQSDNLKNELDNLYAEKTSLECDLNKLNLQKQNYEYAEKICNYEYYYKIALADYNDNQEKINKNQGLTAKHQDILRQIKTLEEKAQNLKESYNDKRKNSDLLNQEIIEKKSVLSTMEDKRNIFDKKNIFYRFFHKKEQANTLQIIDTLMDELSDARNNARNIDYSEDERELRKLDDEIFNLQIKLSGVEFDLSQLDIVPTESVIELFKERTGMNFDEFASSLENAKKVVSETDIINIGSMIPKLERKLQEINGILYNKNLENEQIGTFISQR